MTNTKSILIASGAVACLAIGILWGRQSYTSVASKPEIINAVKSIAEIQLLGLGPSGMENSLTLSETNIHDCKKVESSHSKQPRINCRISSAVLATNKFTNSKDRYYFNCPFTFYRDSTSKQLIGFVAMRKMSRCTERM